MKRMLILGLLSTFSFCEYTYGNHRANMVKPQQESRQLSSVLDYIREETARPNVSEVLTHEQLDSLPDSIRNACEMVRSIKRKRSNGESLSSEETVVSDFLYQAPVIFVNCLSNMRYASSDTVISAILIFLAHDVPAKEIQLDDLSVVAFTTLMREQCRKTNLNGAIIRVRWNYFVQFSEFRSYVYDMVAVMENNHPHHIYLNFPGIPVFEN